MKTLILLLLSSVCFAQSDPTITVSPAATTKQVKITLLKSELQGKHPFFHLGPAPYTNWGVGAWEEDSTTFFTYLTIIYLKLEEDTVTIQAKDFLAQGGTMQDVGTNAGNTGVRVEADGTVSYFNVGDWMRYSINLTGKKSIRLRYSYGSTLTDRKLEARTGSITGTVIAEMAARPTGNWNTFIDHVIPITVDTSSAGIQDVFLIVSGPQNASAYWGNLMEISFY